MVIWINGAFGAGKTTLAEELSRPLREHHAGTLIVPMTLTNDDYLAEILGGLRAGGAAILHVFLDVDLEVLRQRITGRVLVPDDRERDQQAWAATSPTRGTGSRFPLVWPA
ncbi:MAG TPA: hypothetical protein VFE59_40470 [Trebonia sp.]|nr:hypothetical protein [Trebonia sp.]